MGYQDEQMDGLLTEVQTATTEDAKREAISVVQVRVNETVPYALWGPTKVFTVWVHDVNGVKRSADNIILLDGAGVPVCGWALRLGAVASPGSSHPPR